MICPKLRKLLECNCDLCKYKKAVEHAGGPEKAYQQTANKYQKMQTEQRLKDTMERFYQEMERNTQIRKQKEA